MSNNLLLSGLSFTFTCIILILISICIKTSIPAIDVYKGKTTLEITYKDNVPIDSVVVYKK